MNNLKEVLEEYNFKIYSIKYLNKVIILDTNKGKYVYKDKNNYNTYNYLLSKGFNNFPKNLSDKDFKFDLVEYIEDNNINQNERLQDLIYITANLHKLTSYNKTIDLDNLKNMYENIINDANYLMNYYQDLNNYIDNITFMSPSEYLLVSNIDLFYYLISFVQVESLNWYNNLKKRDSIKYSLVHDNLSLDHLIENNQSYLISWDKAHYDMPIIDLIKIYQDNHSEIDLEDLLREYQKITKLDKDEYLLLLIKLSIPKRIELSKRTYLDCYNLSNYLIYLRKIASIIQKIDKNKQKI